MAFLRYAEALDGALRGDARALSPHAISQTISFARIVLIVGLVFLHYEQYPNIDASPFAGVDVASHQLATFVNSFGLFFFFSVVPLLSMVSGWLFFSFDSAAASGSASPSIRVRLNQRIGRRLTSIYLPMVCWNLLYLAVLALLFAWRPHDPLLQEMNIDLAHASAMDFVNAIFGLSAHPVGFQFWFVRDLFVTALVSPLLWLSLKHTPYLGMAFLGVAWIMGSGLLIFFRSDVVFFFYLGGFLRIRQVPLHIGRRTSLWLLAAYLAVVALRTAAPWLVDMSTQRPELLTAATRGMRLLGVLACWGCFQLWAQTALGAYIARFGGLAFFLHSAHYPLIAQVKLVLWPLLPSHTDGWLIAHYLASVIITVGVCMSVGLMLIRWLPGVFALMNGGRAGVGPKPEERPRTVAAPGKPAMTRNLLPPRAASRAVLAPSTDRD